jgi:hypothetical protein
MSVLKVPAVESYLKERDALRKSIVPVKEMVAYVYRPKTKKDKKLVLEGNYPEDLNLFFHVLRAFARDIRLQTMKEFAVDDIPLNPQWYYDRDNPFIVFWISRVLDDRFKGV